MLTYEPTYYDQSLDPLIQQILPDIEESLKKQLMHELQQQAQLQFQKQLTKIQAQAYQEYQLATHDLEEQGKKLFQQQIGSFQKQLERVKKEHKQKEEQHLKNLQDAYISQNFQQLILGHRKIKKIEQQLAAYILTNSQQKIEKTKQRRIKQIAIKLQNRQQKIRKQRDRMIKNEIYQSKSVEQIRKDLQIMKIGIASMRSQFNIKIKKIDAQIKQIRQRNKSLQPKQNINQLKLQLQLLQNRKQQLTQRIIREEHEMRSNQIGKNLNNTTFSHLEQEESPSCSVPQPHFQSSSYAIYRNQQVAQQQAQESQYNNQQYREQSEQEFSEQFAVNPPVYYPSAQVSQENLRTFQSHAPILRLNIASLLRNSWQDPLNKYLNDGESNQNRCRNMEDEDKQENNENDYKNANRLSFQQVYYQHLQKLNKATGKRKLSSQAKKSLIKNLGMLGKNKH